MFLLLEVRPCILIPWLKSGDEWPLRGTLENPYCALVRTIDYEQTVDSALLDINLYNLGVVILDLFNSSTEKMSKMTAPTLQHCYECQMRNYPRKLLKQCLIPALYR